MQLTKEQKIWNSVVAKAWEDESFKQELVASPLEAIRKFTGIDVGKNLPEGTTVVIRDQTDPSKIYLNIPRKVEFSDLQLTDEQLEAVAGGEIMVGVGIGLGIVALFGAGIAIGQAMN
jgi:hypothetical protein